VLEIETSVKSPREIRSGGTMPLMPNSQDFLAINTLRALALDSIATAKEGHPGGPLGMAPMAYVLWSKFLRFNPMNPHWSNRDRFVLSAGHASMLLYGALHLSGFDLSLEDLKHFRAWGSRTPGHPEFGHAPGVETTTGPLGQGFANAVGMALAEAHLAARYNQPGHAVVDHFTYGICSDGDLQEGISHEAASFAGHLGLGKLVMLYDDNHIQLDGPTEWAFSENIPQRFEAYGWHVQTVANGDTDLDGIEAAIHAAQLETGKPSLICVKTTIGYGMPKQGTADVHGKAPSFEDVVSTKAKLEYPSSEPFFVAPDGVKPWADAGARGATLETSWQSAFEAYKKQFPELAAELTGVLEGKLPVNAFSGLPNYDPYGKPVRTRNANGDCINALAPNIPALMGGSADLSGSNMTIFKGSGAIKPHDFAGRNVHFGVREHAMAAIGNGLVLSGLRPYVATFFTFSDYMKNSIRLAALMGIPTIFVFTHDSIGVGTDGPTHQPIEHLAGLRAIPNLCVLRPADANESATAWKLALERTDGPTALIFTRQDVPVLTSNPEGVGHGAYIMADSEGTPDVILIATGSEVSLALDTKTALETQGKKARVVSAPSWDIFAKQDKAYRESVLPASVKARVGIEAGSSFGWERFVGLDGALVCLDRFGASAPDAIVFEKLGFTVENVVKHALEVM
jgi:transketolase